MARSARPRDVLRGPGVEHLLQPVGLLMTALVVSEVGSEGGSEGGSEELRIA